MTAKKVMMWGIVVALAGLLASTAQAQLIKGFDITVIAPDGNPLKGASASLVDLSNELNHYEGQTDDHGEFMATGITYSTKGYKFTVEYKGAKAMRYILPGDKDLKADDSGQRKIMLTEINYLKVDLRKATAFQGVAKDAAGHPIVGAKVTGVDLDDETKSFNAATNNKGEYELNNLPFSGKGYKLALEQEGKQPYVKMLTIPQLGALKVDFDLGNKEEASAVAAGPSPAQEARDLYNLGDYEGALAKVGDALKENDEATKKPVLLIKAQCLDKLGRSADALAAFEEFNKAFPGDVEVVGVMARLAADAGDAKKADDYKKQYVAMGGKITAENYNKGVEALNAGKAKEAATLFEKAIQDDPKDADAHRELARCLAQTGDYAGAVSHLKTYLKMKPDAPDAGQWQAAIQALEPLANQKK
jgi:tetratricopeptide (TPR) repeat protein